ncbi:MAG TPA: iron-sulfur cluster assembly accessory protein [Candidatus Pacearchaeota archaeon]|jgi:iron-sulfur cluster assembly accessory protein|nr:iron-sulfur cluster assembly accessory protein [Candidatus Pacearchaeota archaeon]|tara:strand:- start:158 stop:763 length:606 start_codon:yes stop_codon:yes gene_type:complete
MAKQETQQIITRDTIISNILEINPSKSALLTEMLLDFGIHCIGCGASSIETIGQGVLGHGYTEEQLDKLIADLNKVIISEKVDTNLEIINTQDFKLTLTSTAVTKVKEAMKSQGKKGTATLRVSVLSGGCSGFMYDLQFIDEPVKGDINFKQDGINIGVDKGSLDQLNNIEIDFIDTLNESGFKFNNPNQSAGRGCGKSFN